MARMTPYERLVNAIQFQPVDRVPVLPVLLQQGAALMDMDLPTYFSRGEYYAEGQLRLLEKFGHDAVFGIPHVVEDITAFGGALKFYDNGPPSVGAMALRSYDDIERLQTPDPAASPVLAETLEATRILRHQLGNDVPVIGGCIAPFSLPSMLMGTEKWMHLLFLEAPDFRDQVLDFLMPIMSDFCVAWANAQLAAGADAIVYSDGMASAAVINRQQFIDLALPIVRATIPRIEGPVIHEGVGDIYPMLDLLIDSGIVAAMLTANDSIAQAREMVGRHFALIGNLNNIAMRNWTVEEMRTEAAAALQAGAPDGGFILAAQGPEIPLGVSDDVIHALVEAAHGWQYQ